MKSAAETIAIPACEFEEMTSEIETLKAEKAKLELLVKYYEEQLRLSKHRQFGASSEQTHGCGGEQLTLFNEAEALSDKSNDEPSLEQVVSHTRRKSVGKREQDVSGLPVPSHPRPIPASRTLMRPVTSLRDFLADRSDHINPTNYTNHHKEEVPTMSTKVITGKVRASFAWNCPRRA